MTPTLHNVLYPNVGGGDVGLILDLNVVGLMTTKRCAANCKWKFVCFGQLRGFLVFLCYEFACCVICEISGWPRCYADYQHRMRNNQEERMSSRMYLYLPTRLLKGLETSDEEYNNSHCEICRWSCVSWIRKKPCYTE